MLVRIFGPMEPNVFQEILEYRLGEASYLEVLAGYLYQVNSAPICGEIILLTLFSAGAFAKKPLLKRFPETISANSFDVVFMYGAFDWMDTQAGQRMHSLLLERGLPVEAMWWIKQVISCLWKTRNYSVQC